VVLATVLALLGLLGSPATVFLCLVPIVTATASASYPGWEDYGFAGYFMHYTVFIFPFAAFLLVANSLLLFVLAGRTVWSWWQPYSDTSPARRLKLLMIATVTLLALGAFCVAYIAAAISVFNAAVK
jgi:hypothetical protein